MPNFSFLGSIIIKKCLSVADVLNKATCSGIRTTKEKEKINIFQIVQFIKIQLGLFM